MAEFDTRIQQKIDTQINFETQNPILLNGELAIVKMTDGSIKFKIGNGTLNFNSLDYVGKEIVEQLVQIQQELDNIPDVSEFVTAIDEIQQVSAITPEFVQSFNGRSGNVLPQNGDYTADMVGAAPAGFGLGHSVTVDAPIVGDLDSITLTGWYYGVPVINGFTFGNTPIMHVAFGYGFASQTAYLIDAASGFGKQLLLYRTQEAGVWGPWEWINPPMTLGVEYRTTERFNGKPVYILC